MYVLYVGTCMHLCSMVCECYYPYFIGLCTKCICGQVGPEKSHRRRHACIHTYTRTYMHTYILHTYIRTYILWCVYTKSKILSIIPYIVHTQVHTYIQYIHLWRTFRFYRNTCLLLCTMNVIFCLMSNNTFTHSHIHTIMSASAQERKLMAELETMKALVAQLQANSMNQTRSQTLCMYVCTYVQTSSQALTLKYFLSIVHLEVLMRMPIEWLPSCKPSWSRFKYIRIFLQYMQFIRTYIHYFQIYIHSFIYFYHLLKVIMCDTYIIHAHTW